MTVDQDLFVFVDDSIIIAMAIQNIDFDSFLLVAVQAEIVGQLLQVVEIIIRDGAEPVVELLKLLLVTALSDVDQPDQIESTLLGQLRQQVVRELGIVELVKVTHPLQGFAEIFEDLFLLLSVSFSTQSINKKEIIVDGMSFEKDLFVRLS